MSWINVNVKVNPAVIAKAKKQMADLRQKNLEVKSLKKRLEPVVQQELKKVAQSLAGYEENKPFIEKRPTAAIYIAPGTVVGPFLHVAIIDETSEYAQSTLEQDWTDYTASYLLQPEGSTAFALLNPGGFFSEIKLPSGFFEDGGRRFAVGRNESAAIGNWYDLLSNAFEISKINALRISVDNSGSMTEATVQGDLDKFIADFSSNNPSAPVQKGDMNQFGTENYMKIFLPSNDSAFE